jgi:hypothetical protein
MAVALAAAMLCGSVLAACTSVRDDLGPSDSECYLALPAAAGAVHHEGRLQGVELATVDSLRSRADRLYEAARSAPRPKVQRVCLVAFSGHFEANRVTMATGQEAGRLAVVELSYPGNRLLATLLVAKPPVPFGHSHIGIF